MQEGMASLGLAGCRETIAGTGQDCPSLVPDCSEARYALRFRALQPARLVALPGTSHVFSACS